MRLWPDRETLAMAPAGSQEVLIVGSEPELATLGTALTAAGIRAGVVSSLEDVAWDPPQALRLLILDEVLAESHCQEIGKLPWTLSAALVLFGWSPSELGWATVAVCGAYAYLEKASSVAEQVARVRALLRRLPEGPATDGHRTRPSHADRGQ